MSAPEEETYTTWRHDPKDLDAFGEWYQLVYRRLFYFAAQYVVPDDADDLVQNALVRFMSGDYVEKVDNSRRAVSYITQMMRSEAWNARRRHHIASMETLGDAVVPSGEPTLEEMTAASKAWESVAEALSEDEKHVLRLLTLGMGNREIANVLGQSYSAVSSRIYKLRRKIKDLGII